MLEQAIGFPITGFSAKGGDKHFQVKKGHYIDTATSNTVLEKVETLGALLTPFPKTKA